MASDGDALDEAADILIWPIIARATGRKQKFISNH